MTGAPNNAGDADEDQHVDVASRLVKWVVVLLSVLVSIGVPVNAVQAWGLRSATEAQSKEVVGMRADIGRLDLTLRAFINEKNHEMQLRIALLEQRLAAFEKERGG